MITIGISKTNVGRIAERIVSNELEYHGFRVSDLNKEGVSANADLLAVKDGKTWQIQVKGSTHDGNWWFNYGQCKQDAIDEKRKMFNSVADSFYEAQIVVLVCVKSPREYCCIVLPVAKAEEAAQLNLRHAYRIPNKDGSPKKPGRTWSDLNYIPAKLKDESRRPLLMEEQGILQHHQDKWEIESIPSSPPGR